jgi:hypothetical protein
MAIHYASSTGVGSWADSANILTPCSIYTANLNAVAGDTIYLRGGTYNIGDNESASEGINPRHSGTSSNNRITFASYLNESVSFVGINGAAYSAAVWIANRDWIKVTGSATAPITGTNLFVNMWIFDGSTGAYVGPGSNYNEICYCDFGQYSAFAYGLEVFRVSTIFHNSCYNWVHDCVFHDCGGQPPSMSDVASLLEIGYDDNADANDNASYNVIEDNDLYHGGHNVLGVQSKYNVVRNNTLHNEAWFQATGVGQDNLWYGHCTLTTEGTVTGNAGHCLFEGNTLSHGSFKWGSGGTGGYAKLGTSYNIFRYNNLYANGIAALYMENHSHLTTGSSKYNHVYNNTFFSNGYMATYPSATYPPEVAPGKPAANPPQRGPIYLAGGYEDVWDTDHAYYGNVYKNNLFWKNLGGGGNAVIYTNRYNDAYGFTGYPGQLVCGDTEISNNYTDGSGDPLFTTEGDYGSPSILVADKDWYWGALTPDGSDITTLKTQPAFSLQSSSPVIDKGIYLTQAVGGGSNSTSLVVADAYYFQPGWGNGAGGGAVVLADVIAIGTVSNTVQITNIDYSTKTLTLASPMTWVDGASIWLCNKSDGSVVLYGTAPDVGAYEFVSAPPATSQIKAVSRVVLANLKKVAGVTIGTVKKVMGVPN